MARRKKKQPTKAQIEARRLDDSLKFTTKGKSSFWKNQLPAPVRNLPRDEIEALYPATKI